MVNKERKFKLKSELEVFKALQKYGKLSADSLSKKAGMLPTTTKSIYTRIGERAFFDIRAFPKLEMFPEVPMAFIGFSDIHPVRLRQLREKYSEKKQVRAMILSDKEVLLLLMDESRDKLTELVFEVMKFLQARPALHILSPSIAKHELTIPDNVLDKIYAGLPDKRRKHD